MVNLSDGAVTMPVLLDLSVAFDTIDHDMQNKHDVLLCYGSNLTFLIDLSQSLEMTAHQAYLL